MLKLNKLTLVEIFALLTALTTASATASELNVSVTSDTSVLISQYDTDGDGQLSKTEVSASNNTELKANFESLDANQDGFLTAKEIASL